MFIRSKEEQTLYILYKAQMLGTSKIACQIFFQKIGTFDLLKNNQHFGKKL